MSDFPLLEVVGRGSETQLQVGENLNKCIYIFYKATPTLNLQPLVALNMLY